MGTTTKKTATWTPVVYPTTMLMTPLTEIELEAIDIYKAVDLEANIHPNHRDALKDAYCNPFPNLM